MQLSSQCYLFLPLPYLLSPLELPHLAGYEGGDYKAIRFAHFLISYYNIFTAFHFPYGQEFPLNFLRIWHLDPPLLPGPLGSIRLSQNGLQSSVSSAHQAT